MLKKILKWTGIVLGALCVFMAAAYGYIVHNINERMAQRHEYAVTRLSLPADSSSLQRGAHLLAVKGCYECHGKNMAGQLISNDGMIGVIAASNLTRGKGGLPAGYTTEDWFRALRHGVGKNGRPLTLMPSHETALLSQSDMLSIIAWCSQLPPVNNELQPTRLGPVARVMAFFDKFPLLPVEKIDHLRALDPLADTLEGIGQGKYLAVSCSGCHGNHMKGGAALAPGMLPVPDITAGGNPGQWTQAQFMQTLRTGVTPSGHRIKNEDMPWKMTAQYTDKELASLYQYLRSIR